MWIIECILKDNKRLHKTDQFISVSNKNKDNKGISIMFIDHTDFPKKKNWRMRVFLSFLAGKLGTYEQMLLLY